MGDKAEKVLYEISDGGTAAKTAAEVDKVAVAFDKTAKMQAALTAAQGKSGDIARLAAYRAEATALNSVEAAMQKASLGTVKLNDAMKAANTNSINFREKAGALAGVIGQMSTSFSALTPAAAGANTIFGTLFRTLTPLLGVIGGGPGALIVGGLVAAVTALGAVMSNTAKDAATLALKTDDTKDALVEYLDKINEERAKRGGEQTKKADESALQDALMRGATDIATVDRELAVYQAKKRANELAMQPKKDASFKEMLAHSQEVGALRSANDALDAHISFLQGSRDAALEYVEAAKRLKEAAGNQAGAELTANSSGKKVTRYDFGAESEKKPKKPNQLDARLAPGDYAQEMMFQAGEKLDAPEPEWLQNLNRQREEMHNLSAWKNDVAKQELEDKKALGEKETAFRISQHEKRLNAEKAESAERLAIARQYGQMTSAITANLISSAIAGKKIEMKEVLSGVGGMMIGKGTMAAFDGAIRAAWSYGTDPTAYTLMAQGAAEIAAGSLLAAGGASMGGGATPSAGGGTTTGFNPFASPQRDLSSSSSQPVSNITYVTFTSPFAPNADDGMRIRQSLNAANNVYGPKS